MIVLEILNDFSTAVVARRFILFRIRTYPCQLGNSRSARSMSARLHTSAVYEDRYEYTYSYEDYKKVITIIITIRLHSIGWSGSGILFNCTSARNRVNSV